jgi:thymidine phosphorylase
MSQPLGDAIGNALDVAEAVALLRGEAHGRLRDAAVMFAGEALSRLTGAGMGEGRARAAAALDDGSALEAFRRMVEAQGGDGRVVDDPAGVLPRSPVVVPIVASVTGTLSVVDAEVLGRASGDLGAGRRRQGDAIDPSVGIVFHPKIGDRIEAGEPLGEIHARSDDDARACHERVLATLTLSDDAVEPPPLVDAWYGG